MKIRKLLLLLPFGLVLVLVLLLLWTASQAGPLVVAAAPPEGPVAKGALLAEIHVCQLGPPTCDFAVIQDAVNTANPGDIIKVASGLYNEVNFLGQLGQIVYISKTVTIVGGYLPPNWSAPSPQPTVLDAMNEGRGIYVTGHISPTLENLHITGGDATGFGGGPWAYEGTGGGIYVVTATATIRDCFIYDNVGARFGWGGGGGIYLFASPSTLENNLIISNTAGLNEPQAMAATLGPLAGEGGGIALSGSDAMLIGNLIQHNTAAYSGFGIGGGIYMEGAIPQLYGNILRNNSASLDDVGLGGGIFNGFYNDARLVNTVLIDNFSGPAGGSSGGGLAVEYASPRLLHTTVANNTGYDGSGIYIYGPGPNTVTLTNTILVDQMLGITVTAGNTAILSSVLFYNGVDYLGGGYVAATNVVTGSPLFEADGYHLQGGSPAIDVGIDAGVVTDIDSQLRPYGAGPDLGADEWTPPHITETIGPLGGTLVFTDPRGLTTTVEVPPGAVSQTIVLVYQSVPTLTQSALPGLSYVGPGFDLSAYCYQMQRVYLPFVVRAFSSETMLRLGTPSGSAGGSDTGMSSSPAGDTMGDDQGSGAGRAPDDLIPCPISFLKPVTITMRYADEDLGGIVDEGSLHLYYWDDEVWLDAASTCTPPSTYIRNQEGNVLGVPVCHLTRYSMQGE